MSGTADETAAPPWPGPVDDILDSGGYREAPQACGRGIGLAGSADRWTKGRAMVYRFGPAAQQERYAAVLGRLADRAGQAGFATPTVIGQVGRWLVVTGPEGTGADKPELHPDPDDLITAVGAGMRLLHRLPTDALISQQPRPDDEGRAAVAELCRRSVADGAVDPARLPAPYGRYSPDELIRLLVDGAPPRWEPVLCHGFATARRFIVDGGRFVGFDRIEAPLIADRHFDLAVIHQSVQHHFGPEAVFRFYEAYGSDPDIVRLEHHVLASHLLGRSPDAAPGMDHR